ncbi:RNA polymerase sigma factor [Rhodanobacter terrae]|uniref:RNA polymerase sigma factor n=1 Tax=Rhodanobacter terrae TaxID=418647 RepID=A0ABW0SVX4_9GAMM
MVKPQQSSVEAREFAAAAMRNYNGDLHRFLCRRVRHVQDMDDVMQEVYLRLLRVKTIELVRNPLAYIYGIASHVVSEFNLGKHRGRVVFDSPTVDAMVDNPIQTHLVEGGGHFERQVSEALAQLPPNRLAILLLERRDGLSHEEIATKLGLSVHTVKKYSMESLAHVRASLER